MPENSLDLDALIAELEELEEISTTANAGPYETPFAFTGNKAKNKKKRKKIAKQAGYMIAKKIKKAKAMGESSMKHSEIIREIFGLNYKDFKKDDSKNSRQKVNGAIKEINRKLFEIERIIGRASKLKTEDGVSSDTYWKSTKPRMGKIAERLVKVSHKLRELAG